jgi:hypothetical protein
MIRSDATTETKRYYRGGNSFPIAEAIHETEFLHGIGRAVLFMEPTNRFNNRLNVNIVMDRSEGMLLEVLGPGYDCSDLNRGDITPELSVKCPILDWPSFELPRSWDFEIRRHNSQHERKRRKQLRLARLANDVLPNLGLIHNASAMETRQWLLDREYTGLWKETDVELSLWDLYIYCKAAFEIANFFWERPWRVLGCSTSILNDGRLIYWDIVCPTRKFGIDKYPLSNAARLLALNP